MFYVYVVRNKLTKWVYTGSTQNVHVRLAEHNSGRSKSTKGHLPLELLYIERYNTRAEAVRRERYFKTGQGRAELKNILADQKYVKGL